MSQFLFSNDGLSTFGSNMGSGATTLTVASGTGSKYPSPGAGQTVPLTLIPAGNTTGVPNEIVYATARTGDTFTVIRGQEGTTALNWSTGDTVANMATAAFYNQQATNQAIQTQAGNFADDTGAANAGVAVLSPIPANLAALVGVPIRILKMGSSNTGAYTLNLNTLGAQSVTIGGIALQAGQLLRNQIFEVMWDGSNFELLSVPGVTYNSGLAPMSAETVKANLTGAIALPSDVGLSAFLTFLGYASGSLAGNGYLTFPLLVAGVPLTGIVNWGYVVQPDNTGTTFVDFIEPFPNTCLIGLACNDSGTGIPTSWAGTGNYQKNGMNVGCAKSTGSAGTIGQTSWYMAIGY